MNSAKRRRCRPSRSLSRATAVYIRHRGSLQEVRLPVSQIRNFMKFQSSKLLRSLEISSNPSSQRFFVFQGISAASASASASSSSSSRINSLCPPSISQSSARKLSTSIQPNIQGSKGRCFFKPWEILQSRGTMGRILSSGSRCPTHETVALLLVVLDHPANWHGEITGKLWVRGQNVTRKLKKLWSF